MKSKVWLCVGVLNLAISFGAAAGVLTGAGEALIVSPSLDPWSVGAYYQRMAREVTTKAGSDLELHSRAYAVVLGFDLLPWLTLYGSAGGADARLAEVSDDGTDRFAWSTGLSLYLWKWAGYTDRPAWRLALNMQAELGEYQSEEGNLEIQWQQIDLKIPLCYEVIFARQPQSFSDIHHLELYLGPAFSSVDGYYERAGQRMDFEATHDFGVTGGAKLFLLQHLSIGGEVQYYDELTVRAGIGYSFQ